jgi:DNA-binding NarL/FixJ family response regulator
MLQQALFIGISHSAFTDLKRVLTHEPYELQRVESGAEAFEYMASHEVSVVVCEEVLIEGSGSKILSRIHESFPKSVRILVESIGSKKDIISAINDAEVYRILSAPLEATPLAKSLRQAIALYRVARVQSAIWEAAERQHQAMSRLHQQDSLHDFGPEAELLHSQATPFVAKSNQPAQCIGELPKTHADKLSGREREIVQSLGTGKRVKEIAQELIISTHTVRNHLKAIYRKLNVRSQFELLSLMARHARDSNGLT